MATDRDAIIAHDRIKEVQNVRHGPGDRGPDWPAVVNELSQVILRIALKTAVWIGQRVLREQIGLLRTGKDGVRVR